MNKILVILNIECELFYQIFDGKVMSNLRVKTINHNLGVVISEILDDKDLISSGNIGVILIDDNVQTLTVLKKYLHSNHSILKVFDNYVQAISGNSLENYTSWCIVDSLTEQIRAYSLDEKPKTVSKTLNKTSTKNHFFNKVIDKTFTGNKPNISKKERNELSERWIEKLNQTKQLSGSIIIDGQDEFLNVDYKEFTKWIIGDFSEDIMRKIPNKTVVFIFGEFLNNSIFKGRLKEYYNKLEFKSELEAAEFIINGAIRLCENEADKEIRAIKAKDEECKCYTEPELNELYKGHNIRFFIADAKALKDLYGFKTSVDVEENKKKVEKEIPDIIGERLKINEATKSKLIENARKRCVDVAFVEAEIKKILVFNNEKHEETRTAKRKEILAIINTYVKNKKITAPSEKVEKAILKKVGDVVNTEGFNIDKEQLIKKQLSDFEIFFTNYRNNLSAITIDKLPAGIESVEEGKALIKTIYPPIPWGIIASVLLVLVVIGFGVMQFIPIPPKDGPKPSGGDTTIIVPPIPPNGGNKFLGTNYSTNPEILEKALREVHSTSNRSKIAAEIADKILKDLNNWKIQSEVITSIAGNETIQNKDLRGITDIIIGDRAANPQTIKSIKIKSVDKKNQTIQITLRRKI
jgi:hypothetical protein